MQLLCATVHAGVDFLMLCLLESHMFLQENLRNPLAPQIGMGWVMSLVCYWFCPTLVDRATSLEDKRRIHRS